MVLPIISLYEAETLQLLRFPAPNAHKAAILPFYFDALGVPHYVVYAPVPQYEGEHEKQLPYQIARGTMQAEYRKGEASYMIDRGRELPQDYSVWVRDEPPAEAALREAEEELGLTGEHILTLYDCGLLPYQNPRGSVYSVHMFLAQIADASVLGQPDPYACAARLDGITLTEAQIMTTQPDVSGRLFKATYLTLLEALDATVRMHCSNE